MAKVRCVLPDKIGSTNTGPSFAKQVLLKASLFGWAGIDLHVRINAFLTQIYKTFLFWQLQQREKASNKYPNHLKMTYDFVFQLKLTTPTKHVAFGLCHHFPSAVLPHQERCPLGCLATPSLWHKLRAKPCPKWVTVGAWSLLYMP